MIKTKSGYDFIKGELKVKLMNYSEQNDTPHGQWKIAEMLKSIKFTFKTIFV